MAALIYLDKLSEDVHDFINFLQHKILLRLKYFYAEPNKFWTGNWSASWNALYSRL